MHEMSTPVRSLGIFVGTGACDAHCAHCAGIPHRRYAPRADGVIDDVLIRKTLVDCHARGARSLSLTCSGEPTLSPESVTRTLSIVEGLARDGLVYPSIHLYTNGIRIGSDKSFCEKYLPLWKASGLGTLYVTVHDVDERRNAAVYGVASYPSLSDVFSRIHCAGLAVRANMMLSKETVHTLDDFVATIKHLRDIGADRIAAWPIRGMDDLPDAARSPSPEEFAKMCSWVTERGATYNATLYRGDDRSLYAAGQKLTLFPDGNISSEWCRSV